LFKKYYKDANDSIPENTDLKEKLIGLSIGEKSSKFTFAKLSRYALPVAAVLIIAVSLPGILTIFRKNAEEKPVSSVAVISKDIDDKKLSKSSADSSDKIITDNQAIADAGAGTNTKSMPSARTIFDDCDSISSEERADEELQRQPVFDLTRLALPENMVQISNSDGDASFIFSENCILYYESPEKSLTLYVSNNDGLFSSVSENDMLDKNSAITEADGQFTAYIKNDNLCFKAICRNFSKSEVFALIDSLK